MRTQTYQKVYGYWADENLGIRLYGAIYYLNERYVKENKLGDLKEFIHKTKHQYFETVKVSSVELPYKPANIIKFLH